MPFLSVVKSILVLTVASAVFVKPVLSAEIDVPANYPTIQAAINAASDGDVIQVAPGSYTGDLLFNGKNVRLESTDGPQATTIRGGGGTAVDIGPNAALVGFTVTGGANYFGGGMAVHGDGTVIRGNIFEGNTQYYGGFGAAIAMNNASPIIDRNVFRNNSAQGDTQHLAGVVALVNSSSPRITNNLFYDNATRAINITGGGLRPSEVINNTIVRNPVGIHVAAAGAVNLFRNNLIAGNGVGLEVVFFSSDADTPSWDHNLVYGNTINYDGISSQTGLNGNISADPGFAYLTTTEFRLPQGSPAIDTGNNVGAPSEDFVQSARPVDGNGDGIAITDIGADEFDRPANRVPVALDDNVVIAEDSGQTAIHVLGNDEDDDADALLITNISQPSHGTVRGTWNGVITQTGPWNGLTYQPNSNYHGADTFTYTISDGTINSNVATVSINVTPVNDAPVAVNDAASTKKNASKLIPVLANDIDIDGGTLSIASVTAGANGTVSISGTAVNFTPKRNYIGNASFSYTVSDGKGGTSTATVVVTVTRGNWRHIRDDVWRFIKDRK